VAAPITGEVNTIPVLVQALMFPLVTVPKIGDTNTILVDVQAEILPLVTVPKIGVTIVGDVNNNVLVICLVVPDCTYGKTSAAFMTVPTGKAEIATVLIFSPF
jgi:hypothetical protein